TPKADETTAPPDKTEPAPPPAEPPPPAAAQKEPLPPDPRTWHQEPAPVPPPPPLPRARQWRAEAGLATGISVRPADGNGGHSDPGCTIGGHIRARIVQWLAVRVLGRTENSPYVYDDPALGLPPGTHIDQPSPTRVYLSIDLEPTWSPIDRFE